MEKRKEINGKLVRWILNKVKTEYLKFVKQQDL